MRCDHRPVGGEACKGTAAHFYQRGENIIARCIRHEPSAEERHAMTHITETLAERLNK